MTNTAVNTMLASANAFNVLAAAAAENPLLEFFGNNLSIGTLLAIFWWRECKSRERYEKLYDDERKARMAAEKKCSDCRFTKAANEEFLGNHKDE